jgi:elongation factor P--(R)-beta-lysine ligase
MRSAKENETVLEKIRMRHNAMVAVRNYFEKEEFFEIDSPLLIAANCIETYIDPILVKVNCGPKGDLTNYLHTSPEIYHKRLLSYGAKKIYQLGHVFRDGELGKMHLPEFALLEWYRAGGTIHDLIVDCEKLFSAVAKAVIGTTRITLADQKVIDLAKPFERCSMEDLWKQHAQIDLRVALKAMRDGNPLALVKVAQEKGYALRELATFEDVFHHVMLTKIEPAIGQGKPCVVINWPTQMAALARVCKDDPLFAERFEIYCGGIELANAFSELNDPVEQKIRFKRDLAERSLLGKKPLPIDDRFIQDLEYMPDSVGIAVGFDRLLMLISQIAEIDQVQALPSFF